MALPRASSLGAGRSPLPAAEATSRKRGRRRPPPTRPPPASPPPRVCPRAAPRRRAARTACRRADPAGKDATHAEPLTRAEAPRGPTDGSERARRAARAAVRERMTVNPISSCSENSPQTLGADGLFGSQHLFPVNLRF
ncbi:voltage-dependent P/Q-type calcium channel subunit alpha-1A-like [Mirounga leonina]|uniref:voltage-dependent P/Q-type calcium channel subunit alpha-1A-like n=1 Tax=Mirounga leonina TaxID=9715 RepID=UPI00156C330C|nr:voltage-dependent P/Q-type calcium channel subunit alpha-1A-like [Mirounga leonina]